MKVSARCWRPLGLFIAVGAALAGCGGQSHVAASGNASDSSTTPGGNGSAGPIHTGKVVYTANFADQSQRWPRGSDADRSFSVQGNNYKVELKKAKEAAPAPSFNGVAVPDLVNVAVTTTVQPANADSGVFCRSIMGHSYVFSLGPGPQPGQLEWSISRENSGLPTRLLASGTTAATNQPLAIEGDCVGGHGHDPVLLVLSLGGQVIGQTNDTQIPAPYFGLSGLSVTSANSGASATFGSFQVRAASAS